MQIPAYCEEKKEVVFHATKDLDWFGIRMARLCSSYSPENSKDDL